LDLKRKYKLILVAGARPNFMKIAPIVRALRMHRDRRSEVGGREKTEDGSQRSEVRGRTTEGRGQRTEDGSQRSEVRGRTTEGRRQRRC
jgi:hypothetical protein